SSAFSLERVSKSPAVFDHAKLRWFNAHYLRGKQLAERAELFADWAARDSRIAGAPELRDRAWRRLLADAIADHVETLSDVGPAVFDLLRNDVQIDDTAKDALRDPQARDVLLELASIARQCADTEALIQAT